MALGVCRALMNSGRSIPRDAAVAGCDNLPLGQMLCPSLSTVDLDYGKLAAAAVEDVTCRLLLEKRNLLFESWPKISSDLGIGLRWCQIRHKDAVGMVQEVLDRSVRDDEPWRSQNG